jgi:hypothetical protein
MYFLINAIDASLIDLTRECGVKQNREAKWKISEKKKQRKSMYLASRHQAHVLLRQFCLKNHK